LVLKNHFLKARAKAGNSIVLKAKQEGQNTSLAEQETPLGTQVQKEILRSLEARSGYAGRLQSCGSHIWE